MNDNTTVPAASTASTTEQVDKPALPDRLSNDPRSPFHIKEAFDHQIGIRLNGKERQDVEEYCMSEGWVKVPVGNKVDRRGNPLTIKLKGTVEAYYRV
jgi:hypothetical protein